MSRPLDTILDVSSVYLFGREMDDLRIKPPVLNDPERPSRLGSNNFLLNQLIGGKKEAILARIYLFSFEGEIFELSRPSIYLVHGPGIEIEEIPQLPGFDLMSRSPASPTSTGVGIQTGSFARTLKVWAYDKADYTLRIDAMSGTFEETLLAVESGGPDPRGSGTGWGRSSGGRSSGGRSSGAFGRSSGASGRGWDNE